MSSTTPLTKSLSFRAMRTFALAVHKEPLHESRAAVRWMLDYLTAFEFAEQRRKAQQEQTDAGEG